MSNINHLIKFLSDGCRPGIKLFAADYRFKIWFHSHNICLLTSLYHASGKYSTQFSALGYNNLQVRTQQHRKTSKQMNE